jgi:hypothetical protein
LWAGGCEIRCVWLPCWPLARLLSPAAAPPPSRLRSCSSICLPACRVQLNTDLWQLVGAWATATPQLVKVLVRADEGAGAAICAAVAVPPSATGAQAPLEHRPASAVTLRASQGAETSC